MIYVIDNGETYSDHAVYYVEAPATFLSWLREVLVPYLRRFGEGDMKVVFIGHKVEWFQGRPMPVDRFLASMPYILDGERVQRPVFEDRPDPAGAIP